MINLLSVDVEDYFHASALGVPVGSWAAQEQRAVATTHELLELLSTFHAKATFFVLGWLAERFPAVVAEIKREGHEVACHGYSHQLIYRQSQAEFEEETRRAKGLLEDISGSEVVGYRAASFSITKESLWALDTIAELGFEYDSSIFPIRHDRYGMHSAQLGPHVLETDRGSSLVEIPPSALALGRLRFPVAGGGYFRLYPYSLTRWAIRYLNGVCGRPAVVYIHPWEIDTGQPRADVDALTRFRHYVNIDKVKQRLNHLLSEFTFEPMKFEAQRVRAHAERAVIDCGGPRSADRVKTER